MNSGHTLNRPIALGVASLWSLCSIEYTHKHSLNPRRSNHYLYLFLSIHSVSPLALPLFPLSYPPAHTLRYQVPVEISMVTSGASLSAHRGAGYKKPPSVSSILPPSSYFPSQSLVGDRYRKHRFANTQVPCALGFVSPIALDLVK